MKINIEDKWYKDNHRYKTTIDINNDKNLINFKKSDIAIFNFIHLKESWYRRLPNSLFKRIRKLLNLPTGETMGLMNIYSKPEIISCLNSIAIGISTRLNLKRPYPFVVTSILRTVKHQKHLNKIGYPAADESSHCCGYAADIECNWLKINRPDIADALDEILEEYFQCSMINLIRYGNFYHICLNPDYLKYFKERDYK